MGERKTPTFAEESRSFYESVGDDLQKSRRFLEIVCVRVRDMLISHDTEFRENDLSEI